MCGGIVEDNWSAVVLPPVIWGANECHRGYGSARVAEEGGVEKYDRIL